MNGIAVLICPCIFDHLFNQSGKKIFVPRSGDLNQEQRKIIITNIEHSIIFIHFTNLLFVKLFNIEIKSI